MRPALRCPPFAAFGIAFSMTAAALSTAFAATYRVPTDDVLIGKAGVIVRGRVLDQVAIRTEDGGINTDITIAVESVLKGYAVPSTIVVRQPGGLVGDVGEYYPGIGSFGQDERVLLMLNPGSEGRYRLMDFALGKFHIARSASGSEILRRDGLGDAFIPAQEPDADASQPAFVDPDRDRMAFESYITAVVHGVSPHIEYRIDATPDSGSGGSLDAGFTFLGTPGARWAEFDSGIPITYRDNATGDSGGGCPTGCHDEVRNGILTWNAAPGAKISLAYGGTDGSIGLKCKDQLVNEIQFGDPCNEITDLQSCAGTLAVGGFFYTTASGGTPSCPAKNNPAFKKIVSGHILVNNGVGACLSACDYREMCAHEGGHTIGAGHTTVPHALMAPVITSGRCGLLQADDIAFAQCVYPQTGITCSFKASKTAGEHPLSVTFSSGASRGHTPYTYDYDFGDGSSDTAATPTHVYTGPGSFIADMSVTDSDGTACTGTTTITVNPCTPPVVTSAIAKAAARPGSLVRALVTGTGFLARAVVQFAPVDPPDAPFASAPRSPRASRTHITGRDVGLLWPVGVPTRIRVISATGCPSNVITVTR